MAMLLLILILPAVLAVLLAFRASRPAALALAPWAALPALGAAVFGWPQEIIKIQGLLLGAAFGIDALNRPFLLLTAALWLAGGIAAGAYHRGDPKRVQLFAFHLVTLTGNLGLVLARDAVFFYLFFIIMSFAAFGLVVHAATPEARRAGRVYIILIIVGEALLLPGLWMAVADAESLSLTDVAANVAEQGGLAMLLLAAGFGVKAGVLPLHVWLPLAHPVAPTPASALLSGSMIKAGVLGWISFLPLGLVGAPSLALVFIVAGVLAAYYGAVVGICQRKAKTVLAYSSISQMGLITAAVGIGLSHPNAFPAAAITIAVYSLHHALAKGALFLGVGVVENTGSPGARRGAFALLLVPALALAGAPLTSGLIAKTVLKDAVAVLPAAWYGPLNFLLVLAAAGTTLLMARFIYVLSGSEGHAGRPGLWPPWIALIVAGVMLAILPFAIGWPIDSARISLADWWDSLWPIALGIACAGGALALRRRQVVPALPALPEGDILWPLVRAGRSLLTALPRPPAEAIARLRDLAAARRQRSQSFAASLVVAAERALISWPGIGSGVLITMLVVFLMLAQG